MLGGIGSVTLPYNSRQSHSLNELILLEGYVGSKTMREFFGYSIGPKGVVVFLVKCMGLSNIAWHTDSNLVRLLHHTSLDG